MAFNKGIVEAIGTELYSLVEKLSKTQRRKLKQIMSQLLEEAEKGFDNVEVVYKLSKKTDVLNHKESSMAKLFLYLVLVEGPALCVVNVLVILLILNNHCLKISKKRCAKPTIRDMKDISLYNKLKFLDENGFPYVSTAIDRDLRNVIAHHNFSLDDRGVVQIRGRTVDIDAKIDNVYKIGRILSNFYDLIILKERPEDEFLEVLKSIAE